MAESLRVPVVKVAAISEVTKELAQFSEPSTKSALPHDFSHAGAAAMDSAFIDSENA